MVSVAMNDLVNGYMKNGKDQSDFFRGFIVALKQVMMMKDGLKNIDNLRNMANKGGK